MKTDDVREYWDRLANSHAHAATIDPKDVRGHKNAYIAQVRDDFLVAQLGHFAADAILLDLGCGHGDLDAVVARHGVKVVGLDISAPLLSLAMARRTPGVLGYVRFNGADLPFRKQCLDGVLSFSVLMYINSDEELQNLLTEIAGLLRRGGTATFIEQCRRRLRKVPHEAKCHRSIADWTRRLKDAGFVVESAQVLRHGHFPLLYAIRYGLWPQRWWRATARLERWIGSVAGMLPGDYADVAFVCTAKD